MCLIAFAIGASERWPLVVAANRDEYLDRPTAPLACWTSPSGQQIVSGRDLSAGGTWFGVTPEGRIAFLTNVREANALPGQRSRGELVTRWLESRGGIDELFGGYTPRHSSQLPIHADPFAGFNLIVGDFESDAWHWITNRNSQANAAAARLIHWQITQLKPGCYGLSNAALDTPWPKTVMLRQVLNAALEATIVPPTALSDRAAGPLEESLWAALADRNPARTELLPSTGVPPAREEALSSAFVDFGDGSYGTRSSTLLTVGRPDAEREQYDVVMQERVHLRPAVSNGTPPARPWAVHSEKLQWLLPARIPR